ncbi:MAG: NYN domain-containing protein [Ruminococcus sp.]|nr:NYN domain-containing protein [Ruminococcus sp.]
MNGTLEIKDIGKEHLSLNIEQKGVDMRIGVDISSLAFKKQVDQIILVSGDSDFVPAAKQARREGIDFLLCPMGNPVKDDLHEHIDGNISREPYIKKNTNI